MNNSSAVSLFLILATLGVLAVGSYYFLRKTNDTAILLHTGTTPVTRILDQYSYRNNVQGLIFSATFFIAGFLGLTMIIIPSKDTKPVRIVPSPTRPVEVESESRIAEVVEEEASGLDAGPDQASAPSVAAEKPVVPTDPAASGHAMGDDLSDIPRFEEDDDSKVRIIEGETDVVYGTGPISNQAIINFVNKYTDSALKFLYRKNLDGKMLSSADEGIYQEWENRGMSRAKVKQYIMSVMEWTKLPNEPLHQIWKKVRDQIFDMAHF